MVVPVMVANPYKAAAASAIGRALPEAAGCPRALGRAVRAMRGHAWVSPQADRFAAALMAARNDAEDAGERCVEALQRALDAAPDEVPQESAHRYRPI